MSKKISATFARDHLGAVLRQAQAGPVIITRHGKPIVVILSMQAYADLISTAPRGRWRRLLQEAHRHVQADLAGRVLPPAEGIIHQGRQERDERLADLR